MNRMRLMACLLLVTVAGYLVVLAGNLEPGATPGPTMKTLNEIAGGWQPHILFQGRWELVMNLEAAVDHETGLVWERSPDLTQVSWFGAVQYCYAKNVGDRGGWRLPTIEELMSLVEWSSLGLPPGHPFTVSGTYWSITTTPSAAGNSVAYILTIDNAMFGQGIKDQYKNAWCVRGGHGYTGDG